MAFPILGTDFLTRFKLAVDVAGFQLTGRKLRIPLVALAMEKQGIVRRSDSQWASPLHLVKKSDGTWQPCCDFRRLNLITTPDHYTCPNIGDLTGRLAGCKIFTKLDLRKGYLQVPVREEDICKMAIITPFGMFEFLRMPFGLRNAGQTFQRMIDSVMAGLDFCFIFLDDILVASQSHEEHLIHLKEALTRLQQQGLVLNEEKCVLAASQVEYLGHLITPMGVSPLPDRVKAITAYLLPTTVRGLQTFLGMANFYRRFLKDAALLLRPLTDALKGSAAGKLLWTPEMKAAFKSGKRAVLNTEILVAGGRVGDARGRSTAAVVAGQAGQTVGIFLV